MSEQPAWVPMSGAEKSRLEARMGRIMSDATRDAVTATGIPSSTLLRLVGRKSVLDELMRVYAESIRQGRTAPEAAADARQWLGQSIVSTIKQARALLRPGL
ncbi:hypothetical protein [Streptomyces sp. NPDC002952]|uniref:hypothetical protein n=1 Tax=Streptomyces sp. NPDC002952 TaxID=3364673 RepID=UPI0036737EA4